MSDISNIDVAAIRKRLGLSQPQFATQFGIDLTTLRNWEQGRRRPEGPARVLLKVISYSPQAVRQAVKAAA